MPSTRTYQSRVFSISAVWTRMCSRLLSGMTCLRVWRLFLETDEFHQTRQLRIFLRDQIAELACRHECRMHAEFLAAVDELAALDCLSDRALERGDDRFRRALRDGNAAPGFQRDVDALLLC